MRSLGFRSGEWLASLSFIIRGHRSRFAVCVVFGLLTNMFVAAANPLALKYLFDEGIIRGDFRLFVVLSLAFLALFTAWRIAVYGYRIFAQDLKNAVVSSLSVKMLEKYYRIPYDEVIRRERGYFLSRIYDEVQQTAPLVMDTTFALSNMFVTLVTALVVAVSISLRATLTVLVVVPVVYYLSRKYGSRIRKESVAEKEEEAKVRGVLERAVGSYKTARIFGLEQHASKKFGDQVGAFVNAFATRFKSSMRYEATSGIFMSYVESIAIVSAGYEILVGRMTFGGFMGFMSAFWGVMGAARGIFGRIPDLSRASGMAERLQEFEGFEESLTGIYHADSVRLDGVTFAYDRQDVVSKLGLTLEAGERILVLGPNGCGKSTLAHLIAGLLQPVTGATTTLPLDRVSAILPPFEFVPGTARENLGFAKGDWDRTERLARTLGITAILDMDPSQFSAGQRKRLEILMVLAKPADLYILDEPLAGIDVESKLSVMEAILAATEGRMLLVILHGDSEYYGRFDRIVELAPPTPQWGPVRKATG